MTALPLTCGWCSHPPHAPEPCPRTATVRAHAGEREREIPCPCNRHKYHALTCPEDCWCGEATPVDSPWKTPVDNGKHTDVAILGSELKTAPAVRQHCDPGPNPYEGGAMDHPTHPQTDRAAYHHLMAATLIKQGVNPPETVYIRTQHVAPLDGCPTCGRYDNAPVFTAQDITNGGYLGMYLCPRCGDLWPCSWAEPTGPEGPRWVKLDDEVA